MQPETPRFSYYRTKNLDKPMACRVYASRADEPERELGVVWRAWDDAVWPAWVCRLTLDGPDLCVEATKKAAAMALWRVAEVRAGARPVLTRGETTPPGELVPA